MTSMVGGSRDARMDALAHDDHGSPDHCASCSARTISICRALPHPELRRLAQCGTDKGYEPGATLVLQGDRAEAVFNVVEGVAMLFKLLADGRRQVLGFLMKGDFIGLAEGPEYGFSAQAVTTVQVCRFPRPEFRRFLLKTPALEEELLSRASSELIAAQTHLTLLGRKTAMERVTSFLLDTARRSARLGASPDLVHLAMTRGDIADYLGLTTETVSRTISMLKRVRAIQLLDHGMVRLAARDRLEDLAERA